MTKHIIYMASGNSRRFGKNKLLADFEGKPLYLHGLEMLKEVVKDNHDCTLTVVSQYAEIRECAEIMNICAVDCPNSVYGVSYTIKVGINSIDNLKNDDYLLFVVADQPYLSKKSVEKLLSCADSEVKIARLFYENSPGNPVLFSASLVPKLLELDGDKGGASIIKEYNCTPVYVTNVKELMDIDTVEDLKNNKMNYRHIAITGSVNSGKSTLANLYIDKIKKDYAGYRTKKIDMTPVGPIYSLEDIRTGLHRPISVFCDNKIIGIQETFDGFGTQVVKDAINSNTKILLFDEIGRFERNSVSFLQALNSAFESDKQVVAVLKKEDLPHIKQICKRKDIIFFDMDEITVEKAIEQLMGDKCYG